ncbi:molybdopterin molybdotransferase MoeA [Sphingomonas sp. PAMC 26617]|uniref:molybdopterin molybdotransferase MoeA n=1 Tax=Sphingomonas sp. PAMC 26617 TaxID=1112216 RepID=UPI000494E780|nr:molybdopterin molybdotransferase MoeA [Sphingomonas sp. PAMC 26617]
MKSSDPMTSQGCSALAAAQDVRYSAAMPSSDRPDPPGVSRALETLASASAMLRRTAPPLGIECVSLTQAGGRTLAEPVYARIDSPRRDAAAMDGFALGEALAPGSDQRWRLIVLDRAGDSALAAGCAIRITTGAPLPRGTVRVLPIEDALQTGDHVAVDRAQGARLHVRRSGSDFLQGAMVLAAGRRIDPRALVAIAAADVGRVSVLRAPRVAIVVLGSRQVEPGTAAAADAAVPESLGEALLLFASVWGGMPVRSIRVGDDTAALVGAVDALRDVADVIVLVGGAAHGARAATRQALSPLGLVPGFDGLAVRPGRPTWYGTIGAMQVLALPGNPTAAMTLARLLLAPLLVSLGGGDADTALAWADLPLAGPAAATGNRDSFLCAMAEGDTVRLLDRTVVSGQVMLAAADRLVARPAHGPALAAGTLVPTLRF